MNARAKPLSATEAKEALQEPLVALMVISEIVVALSENARDDDGRLPATRMLWLGGQVSDATAEISSVVNRIGCPLKHGRPQQPPHLHG